MLDAGYGEGIDLASAARRAGKEVIGVEVSDDGCATSFARTRSLDNAHVVQGDLTALPFADETFARTESFTIAARAPLLRTGLRVVNVLRHATTRIPPPLLFAMCRIASPFVFAAFTIPHRVLRHVPGLRGFAGGLPFRHAQGPFTVAGDFYDRFSAPIELRFSRTATARLLDDAGLTSVRVAYERVSMAIGLKD